MNLIEGKRQKRFLQIPKGGLFKYESRIYLKTNQTDSEGNPDCFEFGSGEKLFLPIKEIQTIKVTPLQNKK